jgi:hypothetical protein
MSLRPPQAASRQSRDSALDYEIAQEQASALGRLGRRLEAALVALTDYDRVQAGTPSPARERLVRQAGYALWCFIIQREACGLRDQGLIMRDYRISREVQNRMGVFDKGGRPPSA